MSWLVAFKQIDIVARLEMTTLIIIIGILLIAFAVYSTIQKVRGKKEKSEADLISALSNTDYKVTSFTPMAQ